MLVPATAEKKAPIAARRPAAAGAQITGRAENQAAAQVAAQTERATAPARKTLPFSVKLCGAYFGIEMLLALVFGFLCSPHLFDYDLSMIRVLVLMVGGTVTLWLMSQRSSSTRIVGAITALGYAALSLVDHAAFGALDTLASYIGQPATTAIALLEYAGAVAVALWLVFSPQAKRSLSKPPEFEPRATVGHSWDKPLCERVRTREFWRDMIIYFVTFSLLGHWAEMLFCQLIVAGVFMGDYDPTNAMLWSQWLFPFTAEGAAAVAIVMILHPASRWLVKKTGNRIWLAVILSFLLNAAVCTGIDFTTGMLANQDYQLWDYRELPFNFMGQVCLQNSLTYSIAATLIVWVFYPLMDTALLRMPRGVANALAFGFLGMYLFLAMLYFFDIAALFGGWEALAPR